MTLTDTPYSVADRGKLKKNGESNVVVNGSVEIFDSGPTVIVTDYLTKRRLTWEFREGRWEMTKDEPL